MISASVSAMFCHRSTSRANFSSLLSSGAITWIVGLWVPSLGCRQDAMQLRLPAVEEDRAPVSPGAHF